MARARTAFIVLPVLLVAVLVVLSRVDLHATRRVLAETSWKWGAAGVVANLLSIVVDAARWKAIVGGVRRVSIASAVEGVLIACLGNLILPLKLGEGAKAWVMAKREGLPIATVGSTVLLDRAMDVSTLVLFIALTSIIAPLPASAQKVRTWGLATLVVTALGVVTGRKWIRARRRRPACLVDGTARRILDGFAILGHQHRLGGIVAIAVLAWFTRVVVIWCVMRAFHLVLPPPAAASVLVAVNIGIAAIAVPGNVGVFELSAVASLALWGVPGETALGFAIALHALEVVPTVMFGLVVLATTDGSPWRPVPDVP